MAFSLHIGVRYLRGATRESVKTVTGIAVTGVALGVAALLVVLSITTGFQRQFRDKVLGVNAHVLVMKYGVDFDEYEEVIERARSLPGVAGAGPFLIQPMMLVAGDRTASVLVKGVDPARVGQVLTLPEQLIEGSLEGMRLPGAQPPASTRIGSVRGSNDWSWLEEMADEESGTLEPAASPRPSERAPTADAGVAVAPEAADAGVDALAGIDPERMRRFIAEGGGDLFGADGRPVPSIRVGATGPVVVRAPERAAPGPARADVLSPEAAEALVGQSDFEGLPDDESEARLLAGDEGSTQAPVAAGPKPGIVVGATLARTAGLHLGDRVQLISPLSGLGISANRGSRTSVSREYVVTGIFEAGFQEYDSQLCYVDLYEAQHFYGQGDAVTGVELRLSDLDRSEAIARRIERELAGPFHAVDWSELNRNLFTALAVQKIVLSIVFSLITLVASFMVIVTLVMTVLEKKREIAILKAMGATDFDILLVFLVQGLLVGVIGTAIGLALGGGIVAYLATHPITLDPKVYLIDQLPVVVRPMEFVVTVLVSLGICTAATLVPSLSAARVLPVDGLRYE